MAHSNFGTSVIVGASSGIGEALARRLAAEGGRVVLLARREPELRRIAAEIDAAHGEGRALFRVHDVLDHGAVPGLWNWIESEVGRVDLLVYNAAVLERSDSTEYTFEKDRLMAEVNFVGAMAWLDEAGARMQAERHGAIVGISSIAADRGRRGAPGYAASKAALSTFLESLRNRLTQHGVTVTTIRPGYVDTDMIRGVGNPFWVVSADRAAELILRAARKGSVARYVPARWALVGLVIRCIPSVIFRRLDI